MTKTVAPKSRYRRSKVVTTVNLETDVLNYLQTLQSEFDRDRSYLVNALVKDFRRRRQESGEQADKELFNRAVVG